MAIACYGCFAFPSHFLNHSFVDAIGRKFAEGVQFSVSCFGAFAFAFWSSWQVSLVILALTPFLVLSTIFLIKVTSTEVSRSNQSYAKAASILNATVSCIRTILSLNAIEKQISLYHAATAEACSAAVNFSWLRGFSSGMQLCVALLPYVVLTGFGAYLLYSQVRSTGCDPSGTVDDTETCHPSGFNVFGALMGFHIAAGMFSQVAIAWRR